MSKASGHDVIVVGVGSMGSAVVHTLAARGLSVLGLENFGPAHDQGSAHGGSRIIRQAYFEGPAYVPLLRTAFEGWRDLQEQSGRDLIRLCGGLYIGDPDNPVVTGSRAAAVAHGLPHEILDAAEIRSRFPTLRPADHAVGVYEPNAGYVRPEETVLTGVDLARRHGAVLHFDEPVVGWRTTPGGGVEVTTATARYGADRLVLTPGAWAPRLLPGRAPILVERQIFYWIEPDFTPDVGYECYADGHPVYIEETDGNGLVYGFPMIDGPDGGLKVAFYRQNVGFTTPETIDRTVHADEVAAIRQRAVQLLPHLTGPLVKAATCMYASAPDDHFVLGLLEGMPQVVVACGFSGHGFKFVPVVGEIAADLVQNGTTAREIDLFDVARPAFRGGSRDSGP
jgi:sarcosine oxidase